MRVFSRERAPLKRELGLFGSFSMGFADVGADIFLALGLIAAYAGGAMPFAILIAAFVYACTGMVYAELASAIPVAGGAAAYGRRAFGDLVGFISGWGLALDYLVGISLFAVASIGYLTVLFPFVRECFPFFTAGLVVLLALINLFGIKESSVVNTVLTMATIGVVVILFMVGYGTTFSFQQFLSTVQPIGKAVSGSDFLYSITLAMVTFIGIESISQAAEETRNPGRTIPRASGLAILFVVVFALGMSIMALGIVSPAELAKNMDNPLTAVAQKLPFANALVPLIAFAGFVICLVSANTGIIGVSRVLYSLSRANMISKKFGWVHPKYGTPWVTIIFFSLVAVALAFFGNMQLLGELYAFGALLAYFNANLALIALRIKEPDLPRPFKLGLNVKIRGYDISIISVFGTLSCFIVFMLVILLHTEGRVFAAAWFTAGIVAHFAYLNYREMAPEIQDYWKERISKGKSWVLVPLKLEAEELRHVKMVAELCKGLGAGAILLHVKELPPTLPLDSARKLSPEKQVRMNAWCAKLARSGVNTVAAVRNARSIVDGVEEVAHEPNVKVLFVSKEQMYSETLKEIEARTDIQVIEWRHDK